MIPLKRLNHPHLNMEADGLSEVERLNLVFPPEVVQAIQEVRRRRKEEQEEGEEEDVYKSYLCLKINEFGVVSGAATQP